MRRITLALLSSLSLAALTGCAMWSSPDQDIRSLFSKADAGWLKMSDYERGKHYIAVGDYGLAIEAFNDSLAQDPRSVPAMNGLAIAYDRINREDVARTYFEKALALDAHSPDTLNNIAYLDLSHGNREEALAYFARAKEALASASTGETSAKLATVVENNLVVASVRPQILAPAVPAVMPAVSQLTALEATSPNLWNLHLDRAPAKMRPLQPASISVGVTLPQPRDRADTAVTASPRFEPVFGKVKVDLRIANGTGRRNMAHRFQGYLARKGVPVNHLVNEPANSRQQSTIYYSRGLEKAAASLARLLPVPVRTVGLSNGDGALELILAPDLVGFDQALGAART